ncbi:hypothetical protein EDD86DRAFT_203411, partial [Gorgonomyces haynaldii]
MYLSNPIVADGKQDLQIKQSVHLDVCDNTEALKRLTNLILIGGQKEVERLTVRIEFTMTLSIMDWFVVDRLPCKKTINVGEVIELKKRLAQEKQDLKQETESDSDSDITLQPLQKSLSLSTLSDPINVPTLPQLQDLVPDAIITPLPVTPRLRTIVGGMEIVFAKPPGFNFQFGDIRFDSLLNGSRVAHCVIQGCQLSENTPVCRILLEVEPCVTSSKPLSGLASTASGMLRGAVTGALNGLLFGEWGAGATIVGVDNITVENEQGRQVRWLSDILSNLTIEQDIDAIRKGASLTKKATGDFQEGLLRMAASVLDTAGKQSRCTV